VTFWHAPQVKATASQTWPVGHAPHACALPQPSGILPQRPSHAMGLHAVHWLFSHLVPKLHVLLHAKPFPQASATMPHPLLPPHASDWVTHVIDVGLQSWPCAQVPHWRMCPQPSLASPQVWPKLAQVSGEQSASGTDTVPLSTIAPPVSAEVTAVVPPVVPPVVEPLVEVPPPVPCTG